MKIQIVTPIAEKIEPQTMECILRDMRTTKHKPIWKTPYGNSLIPRIRNVAGKEFLETDNDYLLFIDADMVWQQNVIDKLISCKKDIVGGPYVVRYQPNWGAFRTLEGHKEFTDTGDISFKNAQFPNDLQEVHYISAGMMMIKRECLQKMYDTYKFPFMCMEGVQGDFLSEDYAFCQRAKDIGYQIYADGDITVGHIGKFIYTRKHWKGKT